MRDSKIHVGTTSLPTFDPPFETRLAVLRSLTIAGDVQQDGNSFLNTVIAGWKLGKLKLVNVDVEGIQLGITANEIGFGHYIFDGGRAFIRKRGGLLSDINFQDFTLRGV